MNKPSILVVEDDVPVRCLITTTLKTHGYKYLTASNGETAIMMTTSHNPDIMLLDLGLPDIDGIEVIRSVRTWSNLPIIVLSARSEDSDKIEALERRRRLSDKAVFRGRAAGKTACNAAPIESAGF